VTSHEVPATAGVEPVSAVVKALASSAVFGWLSDGARKRLAAAGAAHALDPGEVLCHAGDAGDAMFIVLEGEVEVRATSSGGRDVRFVALGAGAIVGEMAVLDGGPRSADVAAIRRTRLWRIGRAALVEALENEPRAAVALVAELSSRLRGANDAREANRLLDLGGRLAQLLLHERNARGVVALTQTEMARRLGASREKTNRKLHVWAKSGWVDLLPIGVRLVQAERIEEVVRAARRR
jgi:CRP/FNR family cyclic AMP-dependent transcriptional regulator